MASPRSPRTNPPQPPQHLHAPPLFKYAPLKSDRDIRLIHVPPAYKHDVGIIGAPGLSMRHINLTDSPSYTALSYKWGLPGETEIIIINHRSLSVQANLRPMIQALCSQTQSRSFWIDAICINQQDNDERGHQVMLMGEIYSNANEVVAYVSGKDHNKHDGSLHHTVAEIHQLARAKSKRQQFNDYTDYTGYTGYTDYDEYLRKTEHNKFLNNDYFNRRWIIQEIGLARSVIIHCDGYELPMGMLEQYFNQPSTSKGKTSALRLCQLRQKISSSMAPLETLLYDNAHAMCSNPRDRIYALLSLTNHAKDHLAVDYNIELYELLISVLQVCLVYEDMSPSHPLSFACFLRRQLSISSTSLKLGIQRRITFQDRPTSSHLSLTLCVRSVLKTLRIDPLVEDDIHRIRSKLPSIFHYRPIKLDSTSDYGDAELVVRETPIDEADDDHSEKIGSNTQWIFSFTPSNAGLGSPPHAQKTLAGMSTAAIQLNDEVWQFPRTPVAIIARKTKGGYDLVARALVMNIDQAFLVKIDKPTGNRRHRSPTSPTSERITGPQLERILDWPKDVGNEDGRNDTKMIAVTAAELLRLMLWVDYDNDW